MSMSNIAIEAVKQAIIKFEEDHPDLEEMKKVVREWESLQEALRRLQGGNLVAYTMNKEI